ncbi:MAG: LysE family transporter [Cytophagaceae bacterium]|nr:LysE family transporter [Cytophagaceae bacterium]
MAEIFWHFTIGFIVSFLGSIPIGTVNLAVIQTTININLRAGIFFALGATLIELMYSIIAIKFIAALLDNVQIGITIQMISVPVFIILGIFYFRKREQAKMEQQKGRKSFYNGLVIGLINPLQIPFWIAYGSFLLSKKWIINDDFLINIFIVGICFGTLMVLCLIAVISKKIVDRIELQTRLVNKTIGLVLIGLAIYQTVAISLHFIKN